MLVVALQILHEVKREVENEFAVLTERRDRLRATINEGQSVPQPSTLAPFVTSSENGMEGSSTNEGRTEFGNHILPNYFTQYLESCSDLFFIYYYFSLLDGSGPSGAKRSNADGSP